MNYLSQIELLSDNKLIKEQIHEFENASGIQLPPIFKTFIENYKLESLYESSLYKFFHPVHKSYFFFEKSEFKPNPEIVIDSFLNPSQYLAAKKNVYHYEEDVEIIKDKIFIANIYGGALLLGHREHNSDIIYADIISEDQDVRLTKVGDNIFEYFRKIETSPDEGYLQNLKVKIGDLYKKWGERFWRVRESNPK